MTERSSQNAKFGLSPASLARLFHTPSLIYFIMVAETLSMRETARRLNVASSAIARQIAHMETSLDMPLFTRESRRLRLTPAGEVLLRHAKSLTAPLESAVSELDLLAGLKSGTIKVATVESVGLTILPGLISEFGQRYPRLHVDVRMVVGSEVVDLVVSGEVDIGFTFLTKPRRDIDVAIRRDLPIGAVMRPDHPLASADALTFDACFAHPVALPKRGLSIRDIIDPFMDHDRRAPRSYVEANSVRMLFELAKTGRYVAFITTLGIEREIASGDIVFRPIADKGLPLNRFAMVVKVGGGLRFAPAAFFDLAKTYFDTTDDPRLHAG
ncbi:LysR family transcriptional regulator [Kaistia dalseonensis]|uniref:DNA-binding transcriptional LysR family regulator n=1 Tax=Kaistia dalseonensis TaxID=410840 RepID=A0ABU0H4V2_9HYPH|nr:LysR family transcriptional regulator [Kaistia dalseonensis]MCX5493968.1 LysR family transcriptional regulator [Kaistia dalseonensis]MDQ0436544.1 DNA-binding transcriptional LysR family regulator [Kaistia dalseonensis]